MVLEYALENAVSADNDATVETMVIGPAGLADRIGTVGAGCLNRVLKACYPTGKALDFHGLIFRHLSKEVVNSLQRILIDAVL